MAIPAILITIAKFLGCKVAEKAVDVSLDAAIRHKENKKNKAQLKNIGLFAGFWALEGPSFPDAEYLTNR